MHVTEPTTLVLCVVATFKSPSAVSTHWHSLLWHLPHFPRITKIRKIKQPFSPILVLSSKPER